MWVVLFSIADGGKTCRYTLMQTGCLLPPEVGKTVIVIVIIIIIIIIIIVVTIIAINVRSNHRLGSEIDIYLRGKPIAELYKFMEILDSHFSKVPNYLSVNCFI